MADHPTPSAIMQLGLGFWGSKTLLSATELGLSTELAANGPQNEESLAKTFGLHWSSQERLPGFSGRFGDAGA